MTTFPEGSFLVPAVVAPNPPRRQGRLFNVLLGSLLAAPVVPMATSEAITQVCEHTGALPGVVCELNAEFQSRAVDAASSLIGQLPDMPAAPDVPVFGPEQHHTVG